MQRIYISSKPGRLTRYAPLLLWFMAVLLPLFAAGLIFSSAIKMENDLYRSRMQQKLRVELQKYDTALHPGNFLSDAIARSASEQIMRNWINSREYRADYCTHPVLSHLPAMFASGSSTIENFVELSQRLTGMSPQIVFVISEQEKDCQWSLKSPFDVPEDDAAVKRELAGVWQIMEMRNSFGKRPVPAE